MIKSEDAQFHAADADNPNWAEPTYREVFKRAQESNDIDAS